ncbi:hypothetical protein [Amycolatopsis sp. CA-230715]|uniref:hypothetical protein n=1 Tax=Amycolatopsis sp. CA-230715 TaxID=2745196 RepID=UPI001C02231A|nr:hypothetical protein [Amycolatopsis sp. CA-230715]QWF84650.1 hypothetical protein HUW46_08101 [Amycolatopsis sp. CA-230715]
MTGPVGRILIRHGVLLGAAAVMALVFVLSVGSAAAGEAVVVAVMALIPGLCVGYLVKRAALGWAATASGEAGSLGAGLWRERYDASARVKAQFDAEVAAMPPGQGRDRAEEQATALSADLAELHALAAAGYAADSRATRYPTRPESQEISARLKHAEWLFRQSVERARQVEL